MTPRLTIVLPVHTDGSPGFAAFEDTLLSVLENRPRGCEILCVHDGSYGDPFELGDEVRFVKSDSKSLVDAVAAGCDAAWGRYIHVLGGGHRATDGWTDAAMDAFVDFDVAAVSPTVSEPAGSINGWRDDRADLMSPMDASIVAGHREVTGVHLETAFWRREVLRSLTRACVSVDRTTATYAYRFLSVAAGWRSTRCHHSRLLADEAAPAADRIETVTWRQTLGRIRTLNSIRRHFVGGSSAGGDVVRALAGGGLAARVATVMAAVNVRPMDRYFEPELVSAEATHTAVRRAA